MIARFMLRMIMTSFWVQYTSLRMLFADVDYRLADGIISVEIEIIAHKNDIDDRNFRFANLAIRCLLLPNNKTATVEV